MRVACKRLTAQREEGSDGILIGNVEKQLLNSNGEHVYPNAASLNRGGDPKTCAPLTV
jgi:hypothetical protein